MNREAWLSAVKDTAEPLTDDPDAMTAVEFAALYNIAENTARGRLRALLTSGRVEAVTKWVTYDSNRRVRTRAYRLVKPKGKK